MKFSQQFSSYFSKVFFKLLSYVFWVANAKSKLSQDKSKILVEHFTELQLLWHSKLQKELSFKNKDERDFSVSKKIGIIVPFKDKWNVTFTLLNSLLKQNVSGLKLSILLLNNGSVERETVQGIEQFLQNQQNSEIASFEFECVNIDTPFNFSSINNFGAQYLQKKCDFLFFLNNDTEFMHENTLKEFIKFFSLNLSQGAVGCSLLYPSKKIQHLFLAVGVKIVGAHPGKFWQYNPKDSWFKMPRPVSAVTGAALMLKTEDFFDVGGFDEKLATAYQDADLCLKLQDAGKVNWSLAHLALFHHETLTRKAEANMDEVNYFNLKWAHKWNFGDWYSNRFFRKSEEPLLVPKYWPNQK